MKGPCIGRPFLERWFRLTNAVRQVNEFNCWKNTFPTRKSRVRALLWIVLQLLTGPIVYS
jgi:hypothetical protein